jgi:WD40 repeat protein
LLKAGSNGARHGGEVFACSFAPDGQQVLTAGWDGFLRLWETGQGEQVHEVQAGGRPLSACCLTPDGKRWLCGSLDGMLGQWDAQTQRQLSVFLAHSRPISTITFSADGIMVATASWDRQVVLRTLANDREARTLAGHSDIVSGCRFTPDGKTLVSWSHDGTVRLWEVARARQLAELRGHVDRIAAGAVGPDGRWAVTGSRDYQLKLWDLTSLQEIRAADLKGEPRACFSLLDGETVGVVDAGGRLTLHSVPDLEIKADLATRLNVQCGELSPAGNKVALGCVDGSLRLIAVEGLDGVPLVVTPTQTTHTTANLLQKLFGKSRVIHALRCICPACRQLFELPGTTKGHSTCPNCQRSLRLANPPRVASEVAAYK